MVKVEDVVIIGAGPAGVATAIQMKRYKIEAVLLERDSVGGLLRNANLVENYLGFPKGIPGTKLVKLLERHLEESGIFPKFAEVHNLDFKEDIFNLRTNNGHYYSKRVVVATGTKPKPLSSIYLSPVSRNRIFSEVYPLSKLRDKRIVIVGSGDAAFDYALGLARNNYVIILNHSNVVKCLPLLWERASIDQTIKYFPQATIKSVTTEELSGPICIEVILDQKITSIESDYLLIAIGRDPNLDFLSEQAKAKESMLRKRGLLYFVGDVKNNLFRQAAIAAGEGIRAAMQINADIQTGQRIQEEHR
jgi:thioredoxin reductase